MYQLKTVETKSDWNAFIDLPWKIYKGDPNWVPPLRIAVRDGHDIVYANPQSPVHQSRMRDFGSRLYKRLMQSVTGNSQIASFSWSGPDRRSLPRRSTC